MCPGSPFLNPRTLYHMNYKNNDESQGTYWNNGVETWCNKQGNHVNFVQDWQRYVLYDSLLTWDEAKAKCEADGM